MNSTRRLFALIPAAGKSSRMGRPKLSLPLGDRTILERVIATFRSAEVEKILVVLAPHTRELLELAQVGGADVLLLPEETPDMRATVAVGLNWIEEQCQPADHDAWLLSPADHPLLKPDILCQLRAAWRDHPEASIIVPTHQGRRGHPALIGWHHVRHIRDLPVDQGLNQYLRRHTAETLELPAAGSEILVDLDTPEDYEKLLRAEK